jgi:NitT/TauT family transport system permease protein
MRLAARQRFAPKGLARSRRVREVVRTPRAALSSATRLDGIVALAMTDIPANAAPAVALSAPPADLWDGGWRLVLRNAFPFIVVGALWEIVAHLGIFHPRLFPTLEDVAATFVRLTAEGILPHHAIETVLRLLAGFGLAAVAGVVIGIAMGRSRRAEDYLLPLVSIGAPIPGIAYAPLFLLWFGLGNFPVVLLVGFVSAFPIIFNTWTGVKAVKEIWVRSAQAMGADDRRLFVRVILPGALPYIFTGMRLGLAQAWRILVGVEMLAAVPWGLGWLIFGAREFLNTDVMLAGIVVIGVIGVLLEKQVFQRLEDYTVVRWGMVKA